LSNNTDLLEAALELCIVMSPISVTTRSSTVPVTEIGGGGKGWKVRAKQAALLICYRKEALLLACKKKKNKNSSTEPGKSTAKTGRGMYSPLGMQRLIMLINYQLLLSQHHEPSGCVRAVIIDNTTMLYSEPLSHLVNRKENCRSLHHFHPSAAVTYVTTF
jgi:hypothetical protein